MPVGGENPTGRTAQRSYPCYAGSSGGSFARCAGDAGQGCRGWFRAPARCRSEGPTGRTARAPARDPILAMRGVAGGVSRAARAMRSGLSGLVSRSRAMPVGGCPHRENCPALLSLLCGDAGGVSRAARAMPVRVVGAGFALPRDAGLRPALLCRRSEDRRFLYRARVYKEEPRGRMAPGFPFDFRSDGFQETQILTPPRT